MSFVFIYMTCPSAAEAEKIASVLLDRKMIACANIMAPHRALYRWQGQIERGEEFAVVMKTRSEHFEKVKEIIISLHSHECPCIVSWHIGKGHESFLEWIDAQTAVQAEDSH